MSYATAHNIQIDHEEPTICKVATFLATLPSQPITRDLPTQTAVNIWERTLSGEPTSWPDCEQDMKKVSANWPGVLFTIRAQGEENDNQWLAYHRDGLVQTEQRPDWTPPPLALPLPASLPNQQTKLPVILTFRTNQPDQPAWLQTISDACPSEVVSVTITAQLTRQQIERITGDPPETWQVAVMMQYRDNEATYGLLSAHQHAAKMATAWGEITGERWEPRPIDQLTPEAAANLISACSQSVDTDWELDANAIDQDFIDQNRDAWPSYMVRVPNT